ncbi:HAMP domain-containing histidine kinase [Microvirga brassicacearum]|uniref:histidine kinase n=2 Tax=Microvirga brassicacearum TaxID=2580413 RepID=A0A5N3P3B0_9HYPH|nr:HAMP domain-containing histidine kinase [Microvirga brassicacearum]
MAAVAVFISERVLTRLQEAQTRHLGDLAAVYLDGLAPALVAPVVREDVWEVFDIVDRARQVHAGLKPTETVVATADGRVLASSNPREHPTWSLLPSSFSAERATAPAIVSHDTEGEAVARRDLSSGDRIVGSVHATFDISPLLAERRSVLITLIGTNAALTFALALTAWLTVRRMMRPVRVLASHLNASPETPVEPIADSLIKTAPREFRGLFAAFNRMAEAVRDREALSRHLAEEERLASLGRLASGMAHEINNPLGGLFNAIDTLKEHGERSDVRRRTIDLIDRGLKGIRDVVRTTLVTYRTDRDVRSLQRADIDDLKLLIEPEVRRKNLTVRWRNESHDELWVSPSVVRQVLLNLLLNACQATPTGGEISFEALVENSSLVAVVGDTGPGLSDSARDVLVGQHDHAVVGSGGGLGLWMVRRLIKEGGGTIVVYPRSPTGTTIRVALPIGDEEGLAHVA